MTALRIVVLTLVSIAPFARQPAGGPNWLDRPLANWNKIGTPLMSPATPVDRDAIRKRCQVPPARTTSDRALERAGWLPYAHLDRPLAQGDLEIVAGMTDADRACSPGGFQLFVFVGGTFAGTLSPAAMITATDASAGAVRIVGADAITAEFARYGNKDTPCCPTSRMTVRYRIERTGPQPLVVPVGVRTTRTR